MKTSRRVEAIDRTAPRRARGLVVAMAVLLAAAGGARGQSVAVAEELDQPDGRKVAGRIEGDARRGFRFAPSDGGAPIPMEPGLLIQRSATATGGAGATAGLPPFHLLTGEVARLSGTIRSVSADRVVWSLDGRPGEVSMPRGCVRAIVQRPGEARVLADSFEAIDPLRWKTTGHPSTTDRPRLDREKGLLLPASASGTSLTHELEEPLAAGRLELAFFDDGVVDHGWECVVEPTFRGPTRRDAIRILLGWSEEILAVQSPGGPTLQIQRLARSAGWHRLAIRFGPGETEISVDGRELAHGREPVGPLVAIRLAAKGRAVSPGARLPSAAFDDLRLVRFVEPPASVEVEPDQDEARLVVGDQIFGELKSADGDRIVMSVENRPIAMRWGEVAGLYLRRVPAQGEPIDGLLVRAEWQAAPTAPAADRPTDPDFAEGALVAVDNVAIAIATPYAGTLTIPRDALRRLAVDGRGRRIVLDVAAHHLGDEPSISPPVLDPPRPEGLSLERTLILTDVPDQPAVLVLDVVQVEAEAGDTNYSAQVRKGELRSYASVNGRRIDYLNRHVRDPNMTPERIRLPIPRDLLRPGKNAIRIELTGDHDPQPKFDDLGILQIAVEFLSPSSPLPLGEAGR